MFYKKILLLVNSFPIIFLKSKKITKTQVDRYLFGFPTFFSSSHLLLRRKLLRMVINCCYNSKKIFAADTHLLKLAKVLVISIKNSDRKCGLTLFEEKIILKHLHSFKSDTTQFPRKMRALRICYINIFFIHGKEQSTIKS